MTLDPFLSLPGQKQRTQAKKIWPSGHRTSQRRKPLGPSWAIGGVLFRRKAEITIISEADAAAGPRGKTRFFPDLFPASRRGPHRCQVPQKHPFAQECLFAWMDTTTTNLRSIAQRGSGPVPGQSRGAPAPQPPLCKGGTAWHGHAGGIVKPHCIHQVYLRHSAQDCKAAPPG